MSNTVRILKDLSYPTFSTALIVQSYWAFELVKSKFRFHSSIPAVKTLSASCWLAFNSKMLFSAKIAHPSIESLGTGILVIIPHLLV